ncbi:DinB family protein [Rossellomorea aquimaris]|uniref:DinB family protein n=1 Tax=Rossellomorea aquimaris TaxID=189382 RepID=UPI0007D08703|nr:DinB family protein [Rossellomorea aquimaris]
MIDYRIKSIGDFTPKIGELVSMLTHTRAVTLEEVKDLSEEDLDYLVDESSNSIGSLLLHMASIEFVHGVISFEQRDLNEMELKKWKTALELGLEARKKINNNSIRFYLNELTKVREKTLSQLSGFNDEWLFEEKKWGNGVPYNHYYLWFHVFEDEMNHRGQIRTIKRILQKNK